VYSVRTVAMREIPATSLRAGCSGLKTPQDSEFGVFV
jgi:hypothetical protein